ncbi:MAG: DUF3604 domain-containing protein, partial [Steroidobacteraceae bacterium]
MKRTRLKRSLLMAAAGTWAICASAQTSAPKVPTNPLKNAYFGELHLHTAMSFDAFLFGERVFPEDAYRFAQGAEIEYAGRTVSR